MSLKQKFRQFSCVVFKHDISNDVLFKHMKYAIIRGTYSQLYGGQNVKSYSIYLVNKNNKIYNSCSWSQENVLEQVRRVSKNRAEEMVEEYNLKRY